MPDTTVSLQSQYRNVSLTPGETGAVLSFDLENASPATWNVNQDIRAAYQVFDPDTEVLIQEGARFALSAPLAPGAAAHFDLFLEVPQEPGKYRVYASAMREHVGWAYEQGSPFLIAELAISADYRLSAAVVRVTDRAALSRRRAFRRLSNALFLPFASMWRNRGLSRTLVRREILSRSKGSFGGSLWPILSPLLLILTYFFVFGLVLRSRFEDDPSPVSFALYLLAGMIPWLAFSEAAGRAPLVLFEYRQLIRKVVFPIETLPVNLAYSGLVGEAFALAIFLPGLLLVRGHLPATALLFPVLLVPQLLFTIGVSWTMSMAGAYFRDLSQISGFLLTIWFFLTPICYPDKSLSQLPKAAQTALHLNPLYILVKSYRAIFLQARQPDWPSLAWLTLCSTVLFLLSHAAFYKLRKSFADVL